jgi:hypothetical protein
VIAQEVGYGLLVERAAVVLKDGIVAVTSLWADARCYWPLHLVPYAPASRLPGGKRDPGFRNGMLSLTCTC